MTTTPPPDPMLHGYRAQETVELADDPPPATASSRRPRRTVAAAAAVRTALLRQAVRDKDSAMATTAARHEELHAHHGERLSWRVYRTTCQLRFGYLAFLVMMIILMFSFTLLMEIFFAIFLPSARTFSTAYVLRSLLLLFCLPLVLFFLSYFFEESSRFFFDAINRKDGGLPNFRLALAVVVHYVRHRRTIKAQFTATPTARDLGAAPATGETRVGDDASADVTATAAVRSSFLMSARDDPFVDDDKEEEDRAWEEAQENSAMATGDPDDDDADRELEELESAIPYAVATSPARQRWRRVAAVVKATIKLKNAHTEGPTIDFSTFLIVDFICPVLFELVTLVAFFLEVFDSWSPYNSFLSYVRTGFWFVAFYLVLWVCAHFWSSRNPYMRQLVSNYRRRRRILRREVRELQREKQSHQLWLLDVGFRFFHHVAVLLNPWGCINRRRRGSGQEADGVEGGRETPQPPPSPASDLARDPQELLPPPTSTRLANRLANIRETRAKIRAKNPWHGYSLNRKAVLLLIAIMVTALLSFVSFMLGWPLMGLCMILLSQVLQRRFPQIFGNTFKHFIVAFVALSLVFFSSTWIIGTFVTGGSFKLEPPVNATDAAVGHTGTINNLRPPGSVSVLHHKSIEYPVCSLDYDGLTVLDLALIADAAYGSTPEIQRQSIENRFNGTALQNWTFVAHNDAMEHQVWMELYFPTINMTVLAVRGTASAADALEDLHYWFGITIVQAIDVFIPFLKQLPEDFVVSLLSMKAISKVMPPPVFTPLVRHAEAVRARVGENLVMTGHSLGGAMAAMIGAKTKTQAVSFSGPGLLYSRGRFDLEEQDIRDYVLTLKPQKDIVPRVDALGGMVQELRCQEKTPMRCHSTETHMCELYASCGDHRQRDWSKNRQCLRYSALIDAAS